jgi:hypothetical protein
MKLSHKSSGNLAAVCYSGAGLGMLLDCGLQFHVRFDYIPLVTPFR